MQMRRILSLAPLGLAFATMLASSAEAQRRTQVVICRDGSRFDTDNASVCNRHRGVDGRATEDARRYEADRVANRGRGNGRWDNGRDDRDDDRDRRDRRRDQSDPRYDNRDNRGNGGQSDPRYGGYGSNGRNAVYEFQGSVDKEIQIQLRGNRALVQPIGAGDSRAGGYGRVMSGLPQQSGTLVVERLQGRGDVDVIAQPSAQNNYTATLRVRDPKGGADNYRFVVYFQPNANDRYGTGRYGRN
jgi:hypothetical protein